MSAPATRSRAERRLSAAHLKTKVPGLYPDGGGLYLAVSDTRRRWLLRYTSPLTAKRVEMGLGAVKVTEKDVSGVTLDEARARARQAHDEIKAGLDPIVERDRRAAERAAQAAKAPPKTFGIYAEEWMRAKLSELKNAKHRAQWASTLKTHAALIWDKPIAEITEDDVKACLLHPVSVAGAKARVPFWEATPETAKRTQGRIEKILGAAISDRLRTGENPARWRGLLADSAALKSPPKPTHYAALPYDKAAGFMAELRGREGVAARALEFLVLTAARSGEVRGMTWGELDAERKVWTVPASRMKAGREHRVPLTDRVREILADMELLRPARALDTDLVFPGQRTKRSKLETPPLSDMTLSAVLKRLREGEGEEADARRKLLRDAAGNDVVVHGFRSTFRDWAEDKAGFPARVVEHALAHTIKDKAEAAYRRGDAFDQRVELMEAWTRYLAPALANSATVVPMRARRA